MAQWTLSCCGVLRVINLKFQWDVCMGCLYCLPIYLKRKAIVVELWIYSYNLNLFGVLWITIFRFCGGTSYIPLCSLKELCYEICQNSNGKSCHQFKLGEILKYQLKLLKEGISNTANTKEGIDGQTWSGLKWIAIIIVMLQSVITCILLFVIQFWGFLKTHYR